MSAGKPLRIPDEDANVVEDDCQLVHFSLAGHLLNALGIGYEEVDTTYLRELTNDPPYWEAEIVCDILGVSYVSRNDCPLEAVLNVAAETILAIEKLRTAAQH